MVALARVKSPPNRFERKYHEHLAKHGWHCHPDYRPGHLEQPVAPIFGLTVLTLVLWLILFILCWPLALMALLLYPLIWLLLLPFRLLGMAVEGVFELLRALILLPARIVRGTR
jgi:hypothetical protein